jgi:ribosomal protein L44E
MRLGDDIDAYCSRCRRATDHAIVSLVDEAPRKVRCRTCSHEHSYRKGGGRKEMTAQEAFQKVLASVTGTLPPEEPAAGKKKRKPRP